MLWLAVEAVAAPLPPLWRRVRRPEPAEGSEEAEALAGKTDQHESRYFYEHSVSGAVRQEHPLLPVFRNTVATERRRRNKARPWTSMEQWMLFGGESGTRHGHTHCAPTPCTSHEAHC